ncbi:MAG: hypothetical protein HKN29_04600 [Rhodothermales bacterium]|nr:hypothetical protein [Rhodothermales bacterium]
MNRLFALALALVMALGVTTTATAQSHTVRIEDGQIFVDGTLQPADTLPQDLDLEGLSASLSFSGGTHFRLGEQSFFVEDGRLVAAEPQDDDFVVFVGKQSPRGARLQFRAAPANGFEFFGNRKADDATSPVRVYYEILDGQLAAMQDLHTEFDRTRSVGLAERMYQESAETAEMVKAFPRIELQSYLEDLQGRNEGLYDGIVKEHLMEMETRRLASQIVSTSDPDRRQALRDQLAERLGEIFELKQENRRAEIEQLDDRLRELRSLMDAREKRKAQLIESRIEELLRGSN